MSFLQMTQLAQEHPALTLGTIGTALLTGFGVVAKWIVTRIEQAFNVLSVKVDGHDEALTTSVRETTVRFSQIESKINDHRVEMLTAFQKHADAVAAPLSAVQLQAERNALRIDALFDINERRREEREAQE